MTTSIDVAQRPSEYSEPAWEIAYLFPAQGAWSQSDYFALTERTNRLVEFSNGYVEVLPMPTRRHQKIVLLFYRLLYSFMTAHGLGTVLCAPLRVRLWEGKFREPDIIVMLAAHRDREHETYFDGADFVIEVVSDDAPERDLVTKRKEYAEAGIPEYWIVEPQAETITVLRLDDSQYVEEGRFGRGDLVRSVLLAGFSVDAAAVFDES